MNWPLATLRRFQSSRNFNQPNVKVGTNGRPSIQFPIVNPRGSDSWVQRGTIRHPRRNQSAEDGGASVGRFERARCGCRG
jgi:hypothetical protein